MRDSKGYRAGCFFIRHNSRIWKKVFLLFRKVFLISNIDRVNFYRGQGAKIGDNVCLGWDELGTEPYLVEIGDNVYISSNVRMFPHDGGTMQLYYMGLTDKKYDNLGKIKIGDNCFIGAGSIILKNVTIGKNCIIGAGSVVAKSIPDDSVAAGVPARVIETVQEYYEKNKDDYDDTYGWTVERKKEYVDINASKYENRRIKKEIQ